MRVRIGIARIEAVLDREDPHPGRASDQRNGPAVGRGQAEEDTPSVNEDDHWISGRALVRYPGSVHAGHGLRLDRHSPGHADEPSGDRIRPSAEFDQALDRGCRHPALISTLNAKQRPQEASLQARHGATMLARL